MAIPNASDLPIEKIETDNVSAENPFAETRHGLAALALSTIMATTSLATAQEANSFEPYQVADASSTISLYEEWEVPTELPSVDYLSTFLLGLDIDTPLTSSDIQAFRNAWESLDAEYQAPTTEKFMSYTPVTQIKIIEAFAAGMDDNNGRKTPDWLVFNLVDFAWEIEDLTRFVTLWELAEDMSLESLPNPDATYSSMLRHFPGIRKAFTEGMQNRIVDLEAGVTQRLQILLAASEEELAASEEELAASEEELAASEEELAASEEELAASEEELAASEEELAASEESLAQQRTATAASEEYTQKLAQLQEELNRLF